MQAEIPSASAPSHSGVAERLPAPASVFHLAPLRLAAWSVLISCALAQAWWTRHLIFSDGVSYLDIADHYARGDWRNALNEYWSPLHSWIIAIVFKLFHPSAYWQVSTLHAINFVGFCASLAFLEMFVAELLHFRPVSHTGLSGQTIRMAAYASVMIAGLWHITMGYVSPDMLTMAILIFIAYLQLRIETGRARSLSYFLFGAGLALGFLSRAAFAPVLPLYIGAMVVSLRRRRLGVIRPLLLVFGSILLFCGPFVAALSVVKGHFTWGAAGPANYAWEVDGAPRSIHWQGQPPNLGTPRHATRKVLDYPATYEFASPIAGTYPPWYEPSYWYAGISPHFQFGKQISVIRKTAPYLIVLFLLSPVVLPCVALILMDNWRAWMSRRGILAYWFVLLPLVAYTGLYTLVFMDKRYVGGALVILWTCLSASVSVSRARFRQFANVGIQILCVAVIALFASLRLRAAIVMTVSDAVKRQESEWNLHWMLAERFRQLGVKSGDRIAFIGDAMDSEWARQLGVRIVAEVPVIFERDDKLTRGIVLNQSEVQAFWHAPPPVRTRVLDAFRRAGVSLVVAEMLPGTAEGEGWRRVLPPDTSHLPTSGSQYFSVSRAGYLKLGP